MRRPASSSSIQRASAAGTKWIVPRIGQVRRIAPRSMAASIVLALACLVRRPTAHSEWPYSCACTAPRCVTTSAGSPVTVAARCWLASRLASRSSGVIASSYGALPSWRFLVTATPWLAAFPPAHDLQRVVLPRLGERVVGRHHVLQREVRVGRVDRDIGAESPRVLTTGVRDFQRDDLGRAVGG